MLERFFVWVGSAIVAATLVGCGGGSGSCQLPDCGEPKPPNAPEYSIVIETTNVVGDTLFNPVTDALQFGQSVRITATLKDKAGKTQPGQIIKFVSSDELIAKLSTGNGLTDSNGQVTVSIQATSPTAAGAVTVNFTSSVVSSSGSVDVAAPVSFRANESKLDAPPGTPAYLQYVSATPTRLFVASGASGSANAAETATISFKVLDSTSSKVADAWVRFSVTKRTGGVLLSSGGNPPVFEDVEFKEVKSDSEGIARLTVKSGTQPVTFNVVGVLVGDAKQTKYLSNDQIIVSGKKPDQKQFFLIWATGSTCANRADRIYPCKFSVVVGDENGQPVADGTAVNIVSDTGVVVATQLAGQPSGACLTVGSTCEGAYTGKGEVPFGDHRIVAYTIGNNAPSGKPITLDGSWDASHVDKIKIPVADSDQYIRNCMFDGGYSPLSPNPPNPTNPCRPLTN